MNNKFPKPEKIEIGDIFLTDNKVKVKVIHKDIKNNILLCQSLANKDSIYSFRTDGRVRSNGVFVYLAERAPKIEYRYFIACIRTKSSWDSWNAQYKTTKTHTVISYLTEGAFIKTLHAYRHAKSIEVLESYRIERGTPNVSNFVKYKQRTDSFVDMPDV